MEIKSKKMKKKLKRIIFIAVLILIIILLLSIIRVQNKKPKPTIVSTSDLEKIIQRSDLSTFESIYNGVVSVENKKNPDSPDYYVSYEATVKAGFNIENIKIESDENAKTITVTIPEIKIIDVNVDVSSLDYIFINNKADNLEASSDAYKKCIEDAETESAKESAIVEFAGQNAKNIIEAFIEPFIDQSDEEYELIINLEEE